MFVGIIIIKDFSRSDLSCYDFACCKHCTPVMCALRVSWTPTRADSKLQSLEIEIIEKKMRDEANLIIQSYIKSNMPQTFPKSIMKRSAYDQEEVVQNGKYIYSWPPTGHRV